MRPVLLAALLIAAAAVHYGNGSPAGSSAYLFFAVLPAAALYSRGMQGQNYWLSLTGLVEAWFLFDYCFYGTVVSVLQRSKTPLPLMLGDAYSRSYMVGAAAFLAFACGAYTGSMPGAPRLRPALLHSVRLQRVVFLLFTIGGVVSLAILLRDPETRRQLLFDHVALSPREGMGRYSALLYMLPTTAVALWFLRAPRRPYSRLVTLGFLCLLAAIHLGCGRRLMWACSMLFVFHLLKIRGIFELRPRHLVLCFPLILLLALWMEATKNTGWSTAAAALDTGQITDAGKVFDMVDNSAGRFDTSAALIANREILPYYHGQTFLMAPLQILPVSAGLERTRGVREELGEMIYGDFGQGLVSQEASLVGELYANFSYAGVVAGFLLVGFLCAALDARFHRSRHPMAAIGYGLCLFRAIHQLATASTSWFPLTFLAFVPWLCALAAARICWRRP